jgi:hypothetical protein
MWGGSGDPSLLTRKRSDDRERNRVHGISGIGRSGTGVLKVDGEIVSTQQMEHTIPCACFEFGPSRRVSGVIRSEVACMIPMPRCGHSKGDCQMSGVKFSQWATMTFTAMLLLTGCVTQRK